MHNLDTSYGKGMPPDYCDENNSYEITTNDYHAGKNQRNQNFNVRFAKYKDKSPLLYKKN